MAYDEKLAGRVRDALLEREEVEERKMFGGVAFMVNGHMTLGVVNDDVVVRVGPDAHAAALKKKGARPMDFTGRPLRGMIYVGKRHLKTGRELTGWVDRALAFVGGLPPKGVKRAPRAPARKKK